MPRDAPSKSELNRAGRLMASFFAAYLERGKANWAEFDRAAVVNADEMISDWRASHAYPLRMVDAGLRYYVHEVDSAARVTQRLKKYATIIDKLMREPGMNLSRMEDVGGTRAVLDTQADVNAIVRKLKKNWNRSIVRHRDYVADAKASGYRAHHLIVEKRGYRIEMQLRTLRQDFWANQVEFDSRRLRVDMKSGAGVERVHDYYRVVAEMFAFQDRGEPPPGELLRRAADLYDRVAPYLAGETSEEPS